MDTTPEVRWSVDLCRRETQHLLCCSPENGPCNLRVVESERRRMGPPEWARFQIAAHVRADVQVAMAELWPVTDKLDWETLDDAHVRALPDLVAALWVLIIRGPGNQAERTPLPKNQMPRSRFGFVSEHAAERITRHSWRTLQSSTAEAIGLMTSWLNGPRVKAEPYRDVRYFACTPERHVFAVGGTPHPDGRCWCLRMTWGEWLEQQEAC